MTDLLIDTDICPACLVELPADYPFDHVAIDRAIAGDRAVFRALPEDEQREAVVTALARGTSLRDLAESLNLLIPHLQALLPDEHPESAASESARTERLIRELWAQGLQDVTIAARTGLNPQQDRPGPAAPRPGHPAPTEVVRHHAYRRSSGRCVVIPEPRDIVEIGPDAGIQWRLRNRLVRFRVSEEEQPGHTKDGGMWLTGAEIDKDGKTVEGGYREIYIEDHTGVVLIERPKPLVVVRRPVNRGPARIPAQRRPGGPPSTSPTSTNTSTTRSNR